ncbi:E3 ubiquitin-protein ligase TRIM56 [Holothuria leucospilota]|uniref:E3 ubiquitin-protein ligase TRIM56 n=1 Tax=Holothuria leucospilota TaxID=206669 RepID=A0A9Q1H5X6_HOLLE|nr:E3 ubiquitin-protein ligase TRIM56 [Holothuria leucospilota]
MAQKIIHDLNEDFLHCSICMERFKKPVMLPCLHSFCFHCLKKCKRKIRGKDFSCPVCRQHVDLPEKGVEGLPNNFFLSSLMERLKLVEKLTKETSSKCNFCRGDLGLLFCLDCQLHICSTCEITHTRIPGTGDHVIISSEKLTDEDYLKQIASTQTPRCDEHKEEKLRFYCKTCSQLICRDCTVVSHQGHECTKAENEASLAKERLQDLLEKSKEDSQEGLEIPERCEKSIKSLETQAAELLKEVDSQYNKCVKKLKSDRESLRKKIEKIKQRKRRPVEKAKAVASDVLQAMRNAQDVTSRVLEENNPWEILRMELNIVRSFEKIDEDADVLDFNENIECSDSSSDDYDSESSSNDDNEGGNSDDDKNSDDSSGEDYEDDGSNEDSNSGNSDDEKNSDDSCGEDDDDHGSSDDVEIGIKFKPSKIKLLDVSEEEAVTPSKTHWRNKNLVGKIVRS